MIQIVNFEIQKKLFTVTVDTMLHEKYENFPVCEIIHGFFWLTWMHNISIRRFHTFVVLSNRNFSLHNPNGILYILTN